MSKGLKIVTISLTCPVPLITFQSYNGGYPQINQHNKV